MQSHALFAVINPVLQINAFFYNTIVDYVVLGKRLKCREEVDTIIYQALQHALRLIIEHSKQDKGLALPDSRLRLTPALCIEAGYDLLPELLQPLKAKPKDDALLASVTDVIVSLDFFKALKIRQALLEMTGFVKSLRADSIWETVEDAMFSQALNAVRDKYISIEDFKEQQSGLYTTLPALSILQILRLSQREIAIQLYDSNELTLDNCPTHDNLPAFVEHLVQIKAEFDLLSVNAISAVKNVILTTYNSELNKTDDASHAEVMAMVTQINRLASSLLQNKTWQTKVNTVIDKVADMSFDLSKGDCPTI